MNEIINIGDKVMNRWLLPCGDGYCLVDTGYPWQYARFKERLKEKNIDVSEIKFVIITHMHADHVGFLKELLANSNAKVVYDVADKKRLEAGKNNLNTYISRFEFLVLSKISAFFVDKMQSFPAVFTEGYLDAHTQPLTEFGIEFMFLKGHSEHDLCFKYKNAVFVGDICMNGPGSSQYAPMWIYNKYDLLGSWKELLATNAETLYPSHGKPFPLKKLNKAMEFWRTRGVLKLFSKKR